MRQDVLFDKAPYLSCYVLNLLQRDGEVTSISRSRERREEVANCGRYLGEDGGYLGLCVLELRRQVLHERCDFRVIEPERLHERLDELESQLLSYRWYVLGYRRADVLNDGEQVVYQPALALLRRVAPRSEHGGHQPVDRLLDALWVTLAYRGYEVVPCRPCRRYGALDCLHSLHASIASVAHHLDVIHDRRLTVRERVYGEVTSLALRLAPVVYLVDDLLQALLGGLDTQLQVVKHHVVTLHDAVEGVLGCILRNAHGSNDVRLCRDNLVGKLCRSL